MDGDHLTVNRGKEEAREREREVGRKMARMVVEEERVSNTFLRNF